MLAMMPYWNPLAALPAVSVDGGILKEVRFFCTHAFALHDPVCGFNFYWLLGVRRLLLRVDIVCITLLLGWFTCPYWWLLDFVAFAPFFGRRLAVCQ